MGGRFCSIDDDWALVNDFQRLEAEKVSFQNAQREKHVLNERAKFDFENSERDVGQLRKDCGTANRVEVEAFSAVVEGKGHLLMLEWRLEEARRQAALTCLKDRKKQSNSTVAEASQVVAEAKRDLHLAKQRRKEARQQYIAAFYRLKDGRKQLKMFEKTKRATKKECVEIISKIVERTKRQEHLLHSLKNKIFLVKEIEDIDLITVLFQNHWEGNIKMVDDLEESQKESLLDYIRTKGLYNILV